MSTCPLCHLRHLAAPRQPDDVWMLQELHDVEFFVQVLCVGLRALVVGLERLDHHLPVAQLALKAAFVVVRVRFQSNVCVPCKHTTVVRLVHKTLAENLARAREWDQLKML